jgi:two-component system chemotaxis response regulator CheB
MRSAALVYGPAAVGVVLTGYLDDGTRGLLAIKDQGGVTIVQEPEEAAAPSMPSSALYHVDIDHCARLQQIAALIVELANDAPGAPGTADRTLLELEDRIADGLLDPEDWRGLERHGKPTAYNCPDCRSALYELRDSRLLHFRCRAGHAFSARALLAGQAQARDDMVASLFGALNEEASLARRLERGGGDGDSALIDVLRDRRTRLESHAALLGDWLSTAEPGLAEPA